MRALLHHTAEALTSYGDLGVAEGMLDRLLSRGNGSLPAAGSGSDVVA